MIGHYLLTLTTEQEDRVLTERMGRAPLYLRGDGCRCLYGVAKDLDDAGAARELAEAWESYYRGKREHPGKRRTYAAWLYDRLCERFGEARVNAAIRNRILSNRARRVLA